jgi:NAD+ kinase
MFGFDFRQGQDMRAHFLGSKKPAARDAVQQLIDRYGQSDIAAANYVVAIGGDGTTLKALDAVRPMSGKPVFAMRLPDSVGALGNPFKLQNLVGRLEAARRISIRPLVAETTTVSDRTVKAFGINEIAVSRERLQAAKLRVRVGKENRWLDLVGDGLLIATPIGSTGYNRSAGGSTLPLTSNLLALTGVAVHRPSDWSNTVLDDQAIVDIEVIDSQYRPVRVETSFQEVRQVHRIKISCDRDSLLTLLLEARAP